MDDLLTKEYFHIGTDHIYKELWLNIQMEQRHHFLKPYGGLWTSRLRTECNRLCDWVDYLEDKNPIELERLSYKKSCLIKFREDIKFLQIKNINDFNNLRDSGFVKRIYNKQIYPGININELLDYEKIAEYFDLLYVNFNVHPSFKNFSINAMLALNPNSIEYYKPITVDYLNQQIKTIDLPSPLTNPNEDYYKLVNYITYIFNELENKFDCEQYENYINKLHNDLKKVISIVKTNIMKLKLDLPTDIKIDFLITTIAQNIYREKYLEKQKTLKKQA